MNTNIRDINDQTSRIVTVCYPGGSGGKFLMNCIGLSRHAVLQDATLAATQLQGNLTVQEKHQLLLQRIQDSKQHWNDLGLGCIQLFHDANYSNKPILHTRFFQFDPVIHDLSWADHYFFLASNSAIQLRGQLEIWRRARVIMFDNAQQFLQTVRTKYLHPFMATWQRTRGESWPLWPPSTLEEYEKLSPLIKQELTLMRVSTQLRSMLLWQKDRLALEAENQRILSEICTAHWHHKWNCNQYLDRDSFLSGITCLYEALELDDFNPDLILTFYDAWINQVTPLN